MTVPKILECPFCRSKNVNITSLGPCVNDPNVIPQFYVECLHCLATGPSYTQAGPAIHWWNYPSRALGGLPKDDGPNM